MAKNLKQKRKRSRTITIFLGGVEVKELTYCKDCKNFTPVNTTQYICDEFGGYVDKDDFCSRGEKCEGKEKEVEK